jgi:putative flippase GtrA
MRKLITILKSAAVGGLATAIDLLVLTALIELVHLDARQANLPALIAGVAFQFFGNKFFAFDDRSQAWARQGAMFAAVEAGALALNGALFHALAGANVMPYLAARVLVQALVYFGFSLPLWTKIFTQRSST